jgi:hypothetical protein
VRKNSETKRGESSHISKIAAALCVKIRNAFLFSLSNVCIHPMDICTLHLVANFISPLIHGELYGAQRV